jgi:hypothetical protein
MLTSIPILRAPATTARVLTRTIYIAAAPICHDTMQATLGTVWAAVRHEGRVHFTNGGLASCAAERNICWELLSPS